MILIIVISVVALLIAAGFKALAESCAHGKNRWAPHSYMSTGRGGFWDSQAWRRKYKWDNGTPVPAPSTYYYKLFNLKYKEKFPGSATIFVSLTDCYHASFSMMVSFIVLAVAIWTPWPIAFFIGARVVWGIGFSVAYKLVCK